MKYLNKPVFSVFDVLCAHENDVNVRDKEPNLDRLKKCLPKLESKYIRYAVLKELKNIKPSNSPLFENLDVFYEKKFRSHKILREKYYNEIKKILHNKECPYCMLIKDTVTLDHFLPKSMFKEFAITPINLIPCCSDCNAMKSNKVENIIHPYFSSISNIRWLRAKALKINPFTVKFYCKSSRLTTNEVEIITSHLSEFSLSMRFSSHVSSEISSYRKMFKKTLHRKSSYALRSHIIDTYQSFYDNNKNYWKTALYSLLINLESEYENILR